MANQQEQSIIDRIYKIYFGHQNILVRLLKSVIFAFYRHKNGSLQIALKEYNHFKRGES